jgi:hypothetical protein
LEFGVKGSGFEILRVLRRFWGSRVLKFKVLRGFWGLYYVAVDLFVSGSFDVFTHS